MRWSLRPLFTADHPIQPVLAARLRHALNMNGLDVMPLLTSTAGPPGRRSHERRAQTDERKSRG
jgi:hypothetical protein